MMEEVPMATRSNFKGIARALQVRAHPRHDEPRGEPEERRLPAHRGAAAVDAGRPADHPGIAKPRDPRDREWCAIEYRRHCDCGLCAQAVNSRNERTHLAVVKIGKLIVEHDLEYVLDFPRPQWCDESGKRRGMAWWGRHRACRRA